MIFGENDGKNTAENIPIRLAKYKERVYSIVHSGYDLLVDSKPNTQGTLIDGKLIRGRSVRGEKYVLTN